MLPYVYPKTNVLTNPNKQKLGGLSIYGKNTVKELLDNSIKEFSR